MGALLCAALCAASAYAEELVEFTLRWMTTLSSVQYKVGYADAYTDLTVSDGMAVMQLPAGEYIALRGTLSDGASSSKSTSVVAGGELALDTLDWTWYFSNGAGTEGNPWKIQNVNELKKIGYGVVMGVPTEGICFRQTKDISMPSSAWEGIGTYAATPGAGKAFKGVYDGGGFKISDVTFTDRNYAGIFNQVEGGTIKNLTVENVSFTGAADEFGGAIVGHAANGSVLENLTASGTFASADKPGRHNMAGVVVRLTPATADVKVTDCVNAATVYGDYTKVGGISILSQNGSHKAVFTRCEHRGALVVGNTMGKGGRDGVGGIIAYASCPAEIADCKVTGSLDVANAVSGAKVGSFVGWVYTGSTAVTGGTAPANMVSTGAVSAKASGLYFATVEDGNAAFVADDAVLAAGADTTYRVMAANAVPLTLSSATETLCLDTSIAAYNGEVESGADGYEVVKETAGSLVTYSLKYSVDWGTPEMSAVWGDVPPTEDELAQIEDWATANGLAFGDVNSDRGAAAYLLGMTSVPTEIPTLEIVAIGKDGEYWTVTVKATAKVADGEQAVALAADTVNGRFTVKTATTLDGEWTAQTYDAANLSFNEDNQAVIKVTTKGARFMKAVIAR